MLTNGLEGNKTLSLHLQHNKNHYNFIIILSDQQNKLTILVNKYKTIYTNIYLV